MNIQELQTSRLDINNRYDIDVTCKQLDNIILKIIVYDKSIAADLSNYKVRFKAFKSDQVPLIQNTNITISNNVVIIKASEQLTTTSGIVKAELQFINKNTLEKKSTFYINIEVVASVLDEDGSISTATCTLLKELDNKLNKIEDIGDVLEEAKTIRDELKSKIPIGNTTNNTLNTTIKNANDSKAELDKSKVNSDNSKIALDKSINNADTKKSELETITTNAETKKQEVVAECKVADTKIEAMKSFGDVSEISKDVKTLKEQVLENTYTPLTTDSTLTKLPNCVGGFVRNMQIKGRTLYKKTDGTYIVTWEEGVTIESVGELEGNKIIITSLDSNKASMDKIEILLGNEPLRGIKDVQDIVDFDKNELIRNIVKRNYQTGDENLSNVITNKIITYYQSANPTIEKLDIKNTLKSYENGYLQLENAITPVVNFNYSVKLASVVDKHTKLIDELKQDKTSLLNELDKVNADLSECAKKDGALQTNLNAEMLGGKKLDAMMTKYPIIASTIADFVNQQYLNGNYIGGYSYSSASSDLPILYWGHFIEFRCIEAPYYQIIASKANTNEIYIRTLNASTKAWSTDWKQIATTETVIPTLLNGWVKIADTTHDSKITKCGNLVNVSLMISNTSPNTTPICYSPFIPNKRVIGIATSGSTVFECRIEPDGNIHLYNVTGVTSNWLSIQITYPIF